MNECDAAGCGQERRGRGPYCNKHRLRLALTGSLLDGPKTVATRRAAEGYEDDANCPGKQLVGGAE